MSQATTIARDARAVAPMAEPEGVRKLAVARVLSRIIFASLVGLVVLTAIPYGTSQPWWEAAFVMVVFTLAIIWLCEGMISNVWFGDSWQLVLPLAALALFSLLQTLPVAQQGGNPAGIDFAAWTTLSADPYQTRFFALKLVALTIVGVLLFRYAATSERRLRIVINVVIGVAVASALFGIVRQTTQHGPGFGLALLLPDLGYAQFINRNHFAFLMEMGLGLILGLLLGGGVKRDQSLIYLAALLPIWTG